MTDVWMVLPLAVAVLLLVAVGYALIWVKRRVGTALAAALLVVLVLAPLVGLSSLLQDGYKVGTPLDSPPPPVDTNTASVPVFFGTDRVKSLNNTGAFLDTPLPQPGELLLGQYVVSIPRDVHRTGEIERPTIWTLDVRQWSENPDLHFVITNRTLIPEYSFGPLLFGAVQRAPRQELLLFVHGYNVAFDDAIFRTAQLAYDLKFNGVPILYSWPSNAATLRYVADKDNSLSTIQSFKRFLRLIATTSGAQRIHVIAHSMGNNALVHTLSEMVMEQPSEKLGIRNLVMAAPDIDRREFLRLADAFQRAAGRITLYAADNDRALGASESLHGPPRIGDARPMFLRQGIDSIDASAIIKGSCGTATSPIRACWRTSAASSPMPRYPGSASSGCPRTRTRATGRFARRPAWRRSILTSL